MIHTIQQKLKIILTFISALILTNISAQFTSVGSGSYTTTFPGTDVAGRNSFPPGSPQISGNAVGKPIPTNDWWSNLLKEDHVKNLFNYPLALRTINQGLVVSYIVPVSTGNGSSEPMDPFFPITVGVSGLNAPRATVSDYSDWTVSMNWSNDTKKFEATTGIGMPFIYFTKNTTDVAEITVTEGTVTMHNEMLIITDAHQGSDFAVYAPVGSTWTKNTNTYTSTLNGKNYWSMAYIPPTSTNIPNTANDYKKYAYVFPANTETTWVYDDNSSKLTTTFTVTPDVKEGTENKVLQGLLPHQWGYLSASSPQPSGYSYSSIRGMIKVLEGNSFIVENKFKGILPTLPYVNNYSNGFDPAALKTKITQLENETLSDWTDSYNEGQVMNRLIQTARIAHEMGNTEATNKIVATIKERLEDWLKAESGEVAFLFYYNSTWSSLLGYPAGHGQDSNLNDHHFHWGYFIHAAAFMEQFQPGWASQYGEMINMLVRDAASTDRNDPLFPYLRNFSPYAGHSWANGFATFPFGNDQESTSESMQFASSLIHWGTITNNKSIRDLGIYIYTTEQTATEEYWFDINKRTFKPGYGFKLASRIWGNGYDNQTFWTSDIAAAYGIEMYPIHGGSLYLGHHPEYSQELWNEIKTKTGILNNQANPNLWHDVYWQYLSFIDPQTAINLYNSYPQRELKFGVSDAQTYQWLHAMNVLGRVNTAVTANYPIATSFVKDGITTYVAHNYGNSPITVTFSDGYNLEVPAHKLVTNRDVDVSGVLSANFYQALPGGSVDLTTIASGSGITKVEFYDGSTLIGEDTSAPYEISAGNLTLGIHSMHAKIYKGSLYNVSNIISVQVGDQVPFSGTPFQMTDVIEAGNYDKFEGGIGQNISYFDTTPNNQGDYRMDEQVDATLSPQEGATVGWTVSGEWLEYTIDVQNAGLYNANIRYASGNSVGGSLRFEIDGNPISSNVAMTSTGTWDNWAAKQANNISFTKGKHILRLAIINGDFNLGKISFTYSEPLGYEPPVAEAGNNVIVVFPANTATLDGGQSYSPTNQTLTYTWQQILGPSTLVFDNVNAVNPNISNLKEGIYKCKLTVSDGTHQSSDEVLVIVSATGNLAPSVSITSPQNGASFSQGQTITINVNATDVDGTISKVEFFSSTEKIGEDTSAPYSINWTPSSAGNYSLTAKATDNSDAATISQPVSVTVSSAAICSEASNVAEQGSFSVGYNAKFETVGTNVIVTFELLDTDKEGVVAFLWKKEPFTETQMTRISDLKFSSTLSGQVTGSTISYAVKFAYAGGMSVTKYFNYVVGSNCPTLGVSGQEFDSKSVYVYPNPTSDNVTVDSGKLPVTKVELYTLSGSKVMETKNRSFKVNHLSSGVYLIKIYSHHNTVTKKLIVK